jgi:hypothetical protein
MSSIAIDVVLLPDQSLTGLAMDVSKRYSLRFPDGMALNAENCLPHISLAMGVIERNRLAEISAVLSAVASNRSIYALTVRSCRSVTILAGRIVSELLLENTKDIQDLHEAVMNGLQPLVSYNVSPHMIAPPHPIDDFTLLWIANYREDSSIERFNPHITLGFGTIERLDIPSHFSASSLALCHLGNWCTCRKVFMSFPLKAGAS